MAFGGRAWHANHPVLRQACTMRSFPTRSKNLARNDNIIQDGTFLMPRIFKGGGRGSKENQANISLWDLCKHVCIGIDK